MPQYVSNGSDWFKVHDTELSSFTAGTLTVATVKNGSSRKKKD